MKNHHGGVRRFKMPSNGVNINNLIPVATAGIKTRGENGCKYHFGLVNVRSIKSKEQALVNYITEKDFDIVLMTETWLKPDKDEAWKSASCLNRNGYTLECCDRLVNKSGGIGLIYKSNLKVKILDSGMAKTFEFAVWQINLKNEKPVQLVGIYHPPPSELHKHTITAFTDEFLEKYAEFGVKYNNMLTVGDFNIHVEDVSSGDAEQLLDMCKQLD